MKIACPKCGREYRLDPSRIPSKGARFTCWGCQAKVEVRPLQAGQGDAAVTEAPSSKDLKEHKQAVSEAKAAANMPTPASSNIQNADKEDEGFFTGPGIRKSATAKADTSAPAKSEPMSSAKTAPLIGSKLESTATGSLDTVGTGALKTGSLKPQPLKITCPKCQHEYRIDPSRIPGGGGKFTCRNCQARIEVRPNQKSDDKAASDAGGQKISTSRYQTPPIAQPTMPGAGLVANLTDSKPKTEEELNRPGPITGPFSIKPSLRKEIEEQEPAKLDTEEKSATEFEGESTMVMGSPKKAIEQAQEESQQAQASSEIGFSLPDTSQDVNETPKTPSFDFTDSTVKDSTDKPEAGFNFVEPEAENKPAKPEFNFSTDDATPTAVTISKDSGKHQKIEPENKEKISEPSFDLNDVNSTLAMNNADIASAIKSRTKVDTEEKPSTTPSFDFNFDLNKSASSETSETKNAEVSPMTDDPNATTAIPAAQSSDSSPSPINVFDAQTEVSLPAVKETGIADELDKNKTVPLSPSFTFKLDEPVAETFEPKASEAAKETKPEIEKPKAAEPSFSFTPTGNPPLLEIPSSASENDLMTKKVPAAKPLDNFPLEEKKSDIKIPPPPSLRKSEAKDNKPAESATTAPKAEAPKTEAPKAETPKAEVPKTPKVELPKTPKAEPPKKEAKREEIKTEDLPTPVYNPDIFSPPPTEEPASVSSGWLKGILVGASLALIFIIGWGFFRTPSTSTSSPSPANTEIVKNTPVVIETPDKPTPEATSTTTPKASETPKATPTPSPKASETPKATPSPKASETPKATPTPKVTPTPKATDKPAAGNIPDSAPGSGKFTLQVRATQSQGEAETLGKKLRGSGAEAYVVKADLGAKGVWYRVRVGRYQSFAEAQKAGSELKSKGAVTDFIATTY